MSEIERACEELIARMRQELIDGKRRWDILDYPDEVREIFRIGVKWSAEQFFKEGQRIELEALDRILKENQ